MRSDTRGEEASVGLPEFFFRQLEALQAKPWLVSSARQTVEVVRGILESLECRNVVLAGLPPSMKLLADSAVKGFTHRYVEELRPGEAVPFIAKADVGITWAEFAAAREGSLVEVVYDDATKLASSLPLTHIALVSSTRLLPDISAAMQEAQKTVESAQGRKPAVSIISGPSKTGDIEMRILYGVHGPNTLHVALLDWI